MKCMEYILIIQLKTFELTENLNKENGLIQDRN